MYLVAVGLLKDVLVPGDERSQVGLGQVAGHARLTINQNSCHILHRRHIFRAYCRLPI